jgi:membrane protein YqaA with SNARE-associated domain
VLRLVEGGWPWPSLVLSATAGNLLGSLATYAMGRLGNAAIHQPRFRIDQIQLRRAERWFARWGLPALLLAWLPGVGDPLCLLAGLLRVNPLAFTVLVGLGKLVRYLAIVGMTP